MIYRKGQRLPLNPSLAVDEEDNLLLAEIENQIRVDEEFNQRSIADAAWDNDSTFFDRAMDHFSDNGLDISELYKEEASKILNGLQKRNRKTRLWLTCRLDTLAEQFPEYHGK